MEKNLRYKTWVRFSLFAIIIVSVIALLSIAKIYNGNKKVVGISIELKGKDKVYFLEEKDILKRIKSIYPGIVDGANINQINTRQLEINFSTDPWINSAEVYFDRLQTLIVKITQTQPIARVITTSGNNYYIDTLGKWLPLIDKFTPRLPIITNYAIQKDGKPSNDSLLKAGIITIGKIFEADSFWQAQMAQIAIENMEWVLVPTLGNHKAYLGEPVALVSKLNRLKKFYIQYSYAHGLNKYEKILVQFSNQVIGVKKGETAKTIKDSLNTRAQMQLWDTTQNNNFKTSIVINDTVDGSNDAPLMKNNIITKPTNNLKVKPSKPQPQIIKKPKPTNNLTIKKPKS